ncbi:helix-turn-helix domain-containing protein [Miniimonas arenae]|uniref:Helix-turn-helix domain-containing protein n=2 Tax=Beutenbergiaceae TaxID=125316 RepID=A0A5C5BCG3_9MICO|nr:helix-turn-helix domain-containing protein [Miniimonas arenae]
MGGTTRRTSERRGPMSDAAPSAQIGARLRSVRQASGRSLASVAQAMGISSSALSQIETGAMQPSVNRLVELVGVLGVPVSTIFDGHEPFAPHFEGEAGAVNEPVEGVLVARPDVTDAAHLGQGVTYRRLSPAALPGVDWFESTYPAGSSSSVDGAMLVHAGYESGHVLRGELTFEFTEGSVTLQAGGSLSFAATRPHRVVNTSDDVAVAVWLTLTSFDVSGTHDGEHPA